MLHLVAFPHTRLDGGYDTCAYTQKIAKLRRMPLGRNLIVYGCEGADVQVAKTMRDDSTAAPEWPDEREWDQFNQAAIEAIRDRAEPGDLLLLAGGYSQRVIAEKVGMLIACEPGVGYEGIATPFCAFESHAWRHYVYGLRGIGDGRWFDTVIPNYFDPADFPAGSGSGGYLLFMGRLIERKGIRVAAEIAETAGLPLVVAGPGDFSTLDLPGDVSYVGVAAPLDRARLMGDAVALLAPTLYIEPFGGVAVEAQLCGTPAITPEFGAFSETVDERWRFATLAEAVDAVDCAWNADRQLIREHAAARFSLDAVAPMFDRWFSRLEQLHAAGWYELERQAA